MDLDLTSRPAGWAPAAMSPLDIVPTCVLTEENPSVFLHYTCNDSALRSILDRGFDLRRFGQTAKRYGMQDLAQHDPAGIFCTRLEEGEAVDRQRPWVAFRFAAGTRALHTNAGQREIDLKQTFCHAYGCNGRALTKILRSHGVDVMRSTLEWIVLDPQRVEILGSAFDTDPSLEWPPSAWMPPSGGSGMRR